MKELTVQAPKRKNRIIRFFKKNGKGYLFVSPVILGILLFTIVPMISSLIYSFYDYNVITPPKNFGFQNYIRIFTKGLANFLQSVKVTSLYSLFAIPMGMVLSFCLGVFLNQNLKGMKVFRLIYYFPVIIPLVVSGLLWRDMTDVQYGIMNAIIEKLGFGPFAFFSLPSTALPSLIMLGVFGIGGGMILWIAALKNIPVALYESAEVEGAGRFVKMFKITIPMVTPTIFYVLITNVIATLQTFGSVVVLTGNAAGPQNSLLFYVMNIYNEAMGAFRMGYACALSWFLFLIIALLTFVIFKTSKWVFYGEET